MTDATSGPTIFIHKEYTKAQILKAQEAPGKKKGRAAGGWIHDLCSLRKVITLCPECQPKFNPGRLGYIREKEFPVVQANCDGCKTFDQRCAAYFWEETYHEVRSTAAARRAERAAYQKRLAKEGY
jgi:hypothetical protein